MAELRDFCSKMKQHFAGSNLTNAEADQFYAMLANDSDLEIWLHNECYGMPLCDIKPFVMDQQVMLKKITADRYEIFSYSIYCGISYIYMGILLEKGQIDKAVMLESWSESYPC